MVARGQTVRSPQSNTQETVWGELRAWILSIGNELLTGRTPNGNFTWLAHRISEAGGKVVGGSVVPDEEDAIVHALEEASRFANLVVLTGGLGGTPDDRTRPALARFTRRSLRFDEDAWQIVRRYVQQMGLSETDESLRVQALLPEGAEPLDNPIGSAPGIWLKTPGAVFVALPGVPAEMRAIFQESVLPRLQREWRLTRFVQWTLRTAGFVEAHVQQCIPEEVLAALPDSVEIGFYPNDILVDVVVRAPASQRDSAHQIAQQIRRYLGARVYAEEAGLNLSAVVGKTLRTRGYTLAVAESCTGGYLAHCITSIPGSSDYFLGGVVAYHTEMKERWLDVPDRVIREEGVVSEAVARAMAEGIARQWGADCALATTGIAGPSGGSPKTPVGTVCIGVVTPGQVRSARLQLGASRMEVIRRATIIALEWLRRLLEGLPDADLLQAWMNLPGEQKR